MKSVVSVFAALIISNLLVLAATAHPCEILKVQIKDWADDDPAVREKASKVAREIVKNELVRIDNLVRKEIPIIASFETYDEIEARIKEEEEKSCIFNVLRQAVKSTDAEVRARAKDAVRPPPSPLDGAIFSLED